MTNTHKHITEVQKATLRRLPLYYAYLEKKWHEGVISISSTAIAISLKLNPIQVRKDLASVASTSVKSKVGFAVRPLLDDLASLLGYNNTTEAIVVGVGKLGTLLLSYGGFEAYGMHLVAGFDTDVTLHTKTIEDKPIFEIAKLPSLVKRLGIQIGVIAVPASEAQKVADLLIASGIKAIWNFAPTIIETPHHIVVRYENLAASLASLSSMLEKATFEASQSINEENSPQTTLPNVKSEGPKSYNPKTKRKETLW